MSAATHKQTYEHANPSVYLSEARAASEAKEWKHVSGFKPLSIQKNEKYTKCN